MTNAIAYIRVSTTEQAEHGVSIDAQVAAVTAYAALKGFRLVDVVVDAGVSASKPLGDREGGKKLQQLVAKRGQVNAVIATKLDRLFRNVTDCLTTTSDWDARGVHLHLLDLGGTNLDTSSATGKLMLTVLAACGELERNLVGERTRAALRYKKNQGQRTTRFATYGYCFEDGRIERQEQEQEVVSMMRKLREAGYSSNRIATALNRRNIQARGKRFYSSTVERALAA